MNNFIIRPATNADIPELQCLQRVGDLLTADENVFGPEQFQRYFNDGITLVAEHDNKVIGYILGEYLLGGGVIGWFIVVDVPFRGTKAAKMLITEFKRVAKEHGATWMIAYAVDPTHLAHEKMGAFVEKHTMREVLYRL